MHFFRLTILLFILFASFASLSYAQNDIISEKEYRLLSKVDEDKPYVSVEQMPSFVGGEDSLNNYIHKHIRIYNDDFEPEDGIRTRLTIRFVVERDGSLADIRIIHGMSDKINRRAYQAVKSMPKWQPGKQDDKPVRVYYTLPIRFNLRNFKPIYKQD